MSFYARFYKSLPFLHLILHVSEFICVVTLLVKVSENPNLFFPNNDESSDLIFEDEDTPFYLANAIALASMCMTVTTMIILALILSTVICVCPIAVLNGNYDVCTRLLCRNALFRFISLNCNCPCYQARPHLRFHFRFIYLFILLSMRIIAVVIYLLNARSIARKCAIIWSISCVFVLLQFLLDFYHYRILWHYRPRNGNDMKKTLSIKHQRFIPYHLLGHSRTRSIGNSPCRTQNFCKNRQLEHIMIFHATDYQPQPRWSDVKRKTHGNFYIGFHQTDPDIAVKIAHSDFKPSVTAPQMLGFGIYFARSLKHTFGKARRQGAFICALIRMGKVKEITRNELHQVRDSNQWWLEYDTVYLNHDDEKRDEFCIKSSSQIVKWVIAISDQHDNKIKEYGMNYEFDDTACGCC